MTITCTNKLVQAEQPSSYYEMLTEFQLGWGASARSIDTLWGGGYYTFTPNSGALGLVSGLSTIPESHGYQTVMFGFYVNKGKVLVIESGSFKTGFISAPGLVLEIQRKAGEVSYWVDGTLVYTSTQTADQPLIAEAYLYSAGDSLYAASITALQSCTNYLPPLVTIAGVGGQNRGYAALLPLIASPLLQGATTALAQLVILAGSGAYANAVNHLAPLGTTASMGLITPEYALSAASLPYIHTVAHGITGIVGSSGQYLRTPVSVASDHAYGYAANDLRPIGGMAGQAIPIDCYALLSLAEKYDVNASASLVEQSGIDTTLPLLNCASYSGHRAVMVLPAMSLLAVGTVDGIGRVDAVLPGLSIEAGGLVGGLASVDADLLGGFAATVLGGGVVVLAPVGTYELTAAGLAGAAGHAQITMAGVYMLVAQSRQDDTGQVYALLPALTTCPSGQAWLVSPALTMHTAAREVVYVTYEAYAINLTTGAVSHYTNYPFDNILRLQNTFYGVAADGLYTIGGIRDGTSQIEARVELFQTDFDSINLKRLPWVYASGRFSNGITVTVKADEGDEYEYQTSIGRETVGTHREKIGNGIRGLYYAIGIKNADGGTLDIDRIEALPAILSRAV